VKKPPLRWPSKQAREDFAWEMRRAYFYAMSVARSSQVLGGGVRGNRRLTRLEWDGALTKKAELKLADWLLKRFGRLPT